MMTIKSDPLGTSLKETKGAVGDVTANQRFSEHLGKLRKHFGVLMHKQLS